MACKEMPRQYRQPVCSALQLEALTWQCAPEKPMFGSQEQAPLLHSPCPLQALLAQKSHA